MPDITQLNAVNSLFKKAMTGAALATTNHLCKAEVIQPDLNEMFSDDKYKDVNAEIRYNKLRKFQNRRIENSPQNKGQGQRHLVE